MIKKVLIVVGVIMLGGWLWGKYESHAKVLWNRAQGFVSKKESPEFKLDRARVMLRNLDNEDAKLVAAIAAEGRAVEKLEADIAKAEAKVSRLREELTAAHAHLVSNGSSDAFRTNAEQALGDLEALESALETQKNQLRNHEANRETLRGERKNLLARRTELDSRIGQLQVRLRAVKAAEARSQHHVDATELAKLDEVMGEVEDSIRVRELAMQERGESTRAPVAGTKVKKTPAPELAERIGSKLGLPAKPTASK